MKNPVTPAGIKPATFRFVAQHLNHCATAVPALQPVAVHTLYDIQFNYFSNKTHTNQCKTTFMCTQLLMNRCPFFPSVGWSYICVELRLPLQHGLSFGWQINMEPCRKGNWQIKDPNMLQSNQHKFDTLQSSTKPELSARKAGANCLRYGTAGNSRLH